MKDVKIGLLLTGLAFFGVCSVTRGEEKQSAKKFNVWAAADPHVTVDAMHGVECMQLAFRQSEGYFWFLPEHEAKLAGIPPAFDWDVMLLAGDLTSSQYPPLDGEGEVFVEQFSKLRKHRREDIGATFHVRANQGVFKNA